MKEFKIGEEVEICIMGKVEKKFGNYYSVITPYGYFLLDISILHKLPTPEDFGISNEGGDTVKKKKGKKGCK